MEGKKATWPTTLEPVLILIIMEDTHGAQTMITLCKVYAMS